MQFELTHFEPVIYNCLNIKGLDFIIYTDNTTRIRITQFMQ